MGKFKLSISVSLDGFVAGPNQSLEEPLGEGGERLHDWVFPLAAWREPHGMDGGDANASSRVVEEQSAAAATIMGRNMFGGGPGPWRDEPWEGWWGDDPPFRHPVFVLTHHPREPLVKGDTTFRFVTDGIESALGQAREAAGDGDVLLAGGADVARQYLAAGLLDEVFLHVAPVLLHDGARLLDGLRGSGIRLEQVEAIPAPGVTHLRYRVAREGAGDPARSN